MAEIAPADDKTIYRRGGRDGLLLGAYLSAVAILLAFMTRIPLPATLPAAFMMLGLPVFVWWLLRRSYCTMNPQPSLAMLWAQGVVSFVCGSLITGVVMWVFFRLVSPDFIVDETHHAIRLLNASGDPSSQHAARLMKQAIEHHMLPSAGKLVANMVLLTIFTGSLLSMIVAATITGLRRRK